MSAACQLYAGGVSTACRWRVNCMPANCMPAACQLYVGCMSVAGVFQGWRKKGLSDGGLSSRTRFACPRGLLLGLEARERYVGGSVWRAAEVAGVSEGWRKGLSDGGLSSRTRFACLRGLLLGLEARGRYFGSRRCRVGDDSCVAALCPARGMNICPPVGRQVTLCGIIDGRRRSMGAAA